jgi:HNH endonuclease
MDSPDRCIYCLRPDGPFTKEHVIPEAFGKFGSATMVLNNAVCHRCNQDFGRDLDMVLARDSYEGLLRADIFPPAKRRRDRFRPRRTVMKFPDEPRFGDLAGLRVQIDWSVRRPRLLAQVVVRDPDGIRRHTFTLEELSTADPALFRNRPSNAVQIFALTRDSVVRLQARLQALGVRFRSRPTYIELPPALREPSIVFEIDGTIDARVLRAVGKIAFNYLAFTEGPRTVLGSTFHEMRQFVRGDGAFPAGRVSLDPVLANDSRARRTHEMHVVLVERDQREIWARASLFNSFSYHFLVCRDTMVWYPLRNGHTFDPVKKVIHKLTPVPKAIWVPRIHLP